MRHQQPGPTLQDTLACLDMGAVDTLIVWESLDIQRLELRNPTTGASWETPTALCRRSPHLSADWEPRLLGSIYNRRSFDCTQHAACAAACTASAAIRCGWGATRLTGVSAATAGLVGTGLVVHSVTMWAYTKRCCCTGEADIIMHLTPEQQADEQALRDKETGAELEAVNKVGAPAVQLRALPSSSAFRKALLKHRFGYLATPSSCKWP